MSMEADSPSPNDRLDDISPEDLGRPPYLAKEFQDSFPSEMCWVLFWTAEFEGIFMQQR